MIATAVQTTHRSIDAILDVDRCARILHAYATRACTLTRSFYARDAYASYASREGGWHVPDSMELVREVGC